MKIPIFNPKLISKIIIIIIIMICQVWSEMVCDTTIKGKDTFITCKVFNDNGNLIRIKHYRNGKKNGVQTDYYNSGKISNIMSFKDGCLLDSSVEYHENGRLSMITYYKNCLCDGPLMAFNEKGDTLHKGICANDKQVGLDETWYGPGKRETRTHYNDSGKKHGLFETWREDGTRKDSIVYDNGKMIEIREYFINGKERMWELYRKTDDSSFLMNAVYHDFNGKISGKVVKGEGEYIIHDENGRPVFRKVVSKGIRIKEEDL